MCLILFAYQVHPKYKLIVAANRDEFYKRPTAPVHYWEDHPQILAGRDLERMGTWMGITTSGRFAALTNFRNPKEKTEGKSSRGEVVAHYLKGDQAPFDYLLELAKKRETYPGYNLLVGDGNELYYYSNLLTEPKKLEPGIFGVSNHLLNSEWPKVKKGKDGLMRVMNENGDDLVNELFTLLQNADPAPDELLPQTGVSLEWERILSPMFIKTVGYGTRSSTVLLMTDDEILYTERVYFEKSLEEKKYAIEL